MFPTVWFAVIALIHIGLLTHSFRSDKAPSWRLWYLRLLLTTLTLDNVPDLEFGVP